MRIIKKMIFLSLILFVSSLSFTTKVFAEEGAGFTVTPILGKGQTDQSLGYFSIQAKKRENYPISVNIQNLTTDQDEMFEVTLVRATTTNNGRIDYTPTDKKENTSGVYLEDLLDGNEKKSEKISIAPQKNKVVSFNLKIPHEGIKGVLLGSVYVKKIPKNDEKLNGTGVRNTFAMTIPVMISENFQKKVTPKLRVEHAKLESNAGAPNLIGVVENCSPSMFGQIFIDAWVTKKGNNEKLYESKNDNYEMAPYSSFDYSIDTKNKLPRPGNYTYHFQIKSGDKVFNLDKDFTISQRNRETINDKLIHKEEESRSSWWLYIGLFILVVLVVIGGYRLGRKKGKR